jgi:hypothetical protein
MENPEKTSSAPQKGWSATSKTVLGCGIATIILACACGIVILTLICAVAGYFAYTSREAKTLGIEVNHPRIAQVGDRYELTLYLKNMGDEDFEVQTIDLTPAANGIYDSMLAGATVLKTEPIMTSTWISSANMRIYDYYQVVKPGETQKVTFYFQAVNAGSYDTDILVTLSDSEASKSDIMIYITP